MGGGGGGGGPVVLGRLALRNLAVLPPGGAKATRKNLSLYDGPTAEEKRKGEKK